MNIGLGIGIPFTRSSLWASIFTPSALFLDGSTQGVWYDPSDINLTWRRNLLTYSEQFDNTVWTKSSCTITPNATTAPDGTLTADRAVFTSGGLLYVNSVPASAGTYVFSGYVKSATGSTQTMQIFGNGTLTYSGDLPVTADWTRVSFKFTYSAVTSGFATSSGQALDIYIWGAQLEQGSTATPYQRITDGIQDYLQYQAQPVLYRDAAGTLPVTAVEQPVGLMLDKSGGGNHAFNPSGNSANFPVLSARYNLLTKTEQFDDAVWTKQGSPVITPDTTVAPDGSLTADTLAISPSNYVYQSINITAGVTYTLSCWVKVASGVNQFKLNVFGPGNNFTSDVKTATTNWQQFLFTFTSIVSGATNLYAPIVDGLIGGNFYIWGADLRVANDALGQPAYQRVNTATDYDTVGFKPYVRFNGVNQWLQTNSIDFSYSDKMFVCAGVRKLSDATIGMIAEISTGDASGSCQMYGYGSAYTFASIGTTGSSASASGYPAAITSVLSGIGNISGDQAILRVNGTQAAISTEDQGTGNYGNYPLYIGARAGSSLWFNGNLYQLVIAAGSEIRITEEDSDLFLSESGDFITAETTVAVIQSAIEQTEAFVNRKTSAF